jgi:hypothetical protein
MCTIYTAIKFQNIPTGNLKDNKESLKKKNILKNQDQSILPCKFKLFRRHIIFFCSTLSEFENFLLCERILINVTTCQNETSS